MKLQRYEGSVDNYTGESYDRRGNRIKLIYPMDHPRVYDDEIPRPDFHFAMRRYERTKLVCWYRIAKNLWLKSYLKVTNKKIDRS
jgi:hypothetical protein